MILICVVFFTAHVIASPFRSARDNRFESVTLFALVMIGLLSQSQQQASSSSLPVSAQVLVSLIVIAIGIIFFVIKIVPMLRPKLAQCWSSVTGTGIAGPRGAALAGSVNGDPFDSTVSTYTPPEIVPAPSGEVSMRPLIPSHDDADAKRRHMINDL